MSTTRTITLLLLLGTYAGMTKAMTNSTAQRSLDMAYVARLAKAAEAVPSLKTEKASVRHAWGVLEADTCNQLERGEIPANLESTNPVRRVEGYQQSFVLADTTKGDITYGTFATPEEAHAAFVYASTTTAALWYPDVLLAEQLTPKPDEVLFAKPNACILRRGTTCVRIGIVQGDETARMPQVIEIANRILAEIAAAETGE